MSSGALKTPLFLWYYSQISKMPHARWEGGFKTHRILNFPGKIYLPEDVHNLLSKPDAAKPPWAKGSKYWRANGYNQNPRSSMEQ